MKRSTLITIYIFFLFMYFFGFQMVAELKYGIRPRLEKYFGPFDISNMVITGIMILLTHCVVMRRWYNRRPAYRFWLGLPALLVIFILLRYSIEELLYPAMLGFRNYAPSTTFSFYAADNIYYGGITIFIGFVSFLLDDQFRSQRQKNQLQAQSRGAELKFLRSQMNPHFLFNSLNNIYALSYSQNPAATGAILKLSDMMRYLTYEKAEQVPLEKELKFVNDLVALQQLRLDHELLYHPQISAEALQCQAPPFVLIPLVENALKHGRFRQRPLLLQVQVTGGSLQVRVENEKSTAKKDAAGGVGLENIQKRLALLYPAGHYKFEILETADTFTVNLQIPLST